MLFSGEITDFKIISNVLRAIAIKDFIILQPMEDGLKVTLNDMGCIELSAYVPKNVFSDYRIAADQDIILKVCLKTLVEILNIFGDDGSPSLKMSYKAVGEPLCLIMCRMEDNVTIDCQIRTMNIEDFNDISLADECNINKCIIKADILLELLNRLNDLSDELQITLSPDPPYFTMVSTGLAGKSEVNISKNSTSISVHQCEKLITATYSYSNIKYILKVMSHADQVSVSIGESGLLGLQMVINSEDRQIFVECYITSHYLKD